jgi:hypothetical protein
VSLGSLPGAQISCGGIIDGPIWPDDDAIVRLGVLAVDVTQAAHRGDAFRVSVKGAAVAAAARRFQPQSLAPLDMDPDIFEAIGGTCSAVRLFVVNLLAHLPRRRQRRGCKPPALTEQEDIGLFFQEFDFVDRAKTTAMRPDHRNRA